MANSNEEEDLRGRDLRQGLSSFSSHDKQLERVLTSVAWVTPLIIGANVLVFTAMAVTFKAVEGFNPFQLALWGGNSGTLDLSGQWWRLLSYQFLHANLLHIAINMWVIWNVGRLTERLYGSFVLLFLYLAAGVLAGLLSIVWNPELISVGASGSIFGVLGAFLAFVLRFRNEAPSSVLRYWFPALVFTGYNLFAGAYQAGVDNAAHVGGLIAGFGLGAIVARRPDLRLTFPFFRMATAMLFAAALALPLLWYLNAFDHRPSALEVFAANHHWYTDDETKNLQLWQSLAFQISSGSISNDEAQKQFEQNIVPFWKVADTRLQAELKDTRHSNNPFLPAIADFAKLRLAWAQAIAAAMGGNPQSAQKALAYSQQNELVQAAIDRLRLRSEAGNFSAPLSQNRVATWIKSQLPGFQQSCVDPPASVQKPLSATDAIGDGPAQRHAIGCRAQQMFMTGDYAALDALMRTDPRTLSDLPDGSSQIEGIWNGLDDLLNYSGISLEEVMRHTSEWRKSVKGSVEPDLVEVLTFRDWAYSARGHGFASSVSPQAMQIYSARTAMAMVGLRDVKQFAGASPMWYVLSLRVDRDRSFPIESQRALFDQGIARFPGYLPLYRQMLVSLMPRWDGSTQAVDDFIRSASKKDGRIDSATYAYLYLIYGNLEGGDYNVIESANADSAILKQGMVELRKRYPRSDFILNSVARFACIDNEWLGYRSLSPLLRGHTSAPAWPDKLSVASCNRWSS